MSMAIIGSSGALGEYVGSDKDRIPRRNLTEYCSVPRMHHSDSVTRIEALNEDSNNNDPDVNSPLVDQLENAEQVLVTIKF